MLQITVPAEVASTLTAALMRAGPRECGGILLGEHIGVNNFAVRQLTVQHPRAFATFVRSMSGVLSAIRSFTSARGNDFTHFNYLGEWHSHPLFSVQPSGRDHASMRDIATDPKTKANFVVLLIFRLHGTALQGSAHTYLTDGTCHVSELDIEGAK